jgi:hypothetical protein
MYLRLKFRAANEAEKPLFIDQPKKEESKSSISNEDIISMINALDLKL